MPEDGRQPRARLLEGIPEDIRDFVRCRRDSIDIEAGQLDWFPNLPLTLSFPEGAQGSTTIRVVGAGGAIDVTIPVSVQGGRLVADTSGELLLGDAIGQWVNDFNADLEAAGNQLSDASIRDGKLHLTKEPITEATDTAVTTPTPGVQKPPLRPPPPPTDIVSGRPGRGPGGQRSQAGCSS